MRGIVLAMAGLGCVVLAASVASADFVAYNDFGGATSGYDGGNVTPYQSGSGALYDYSTGEATGVTMSLSFAKDPSGGALTEGTPAYDVFIGKVNVDGYISNTYKHALTISFSGLDPASRYDVVLFGDAGLTGNGTSNVYTIGGTATPSSFTNLSSGTISGTYQQTATMNVGYNSLTGSIAAYLDIDPGADGKFLITVTSLGGDGVWRLNALMLETVFDANAPANLEALLAESNQGGLLSGSLNPIPEPISLVLLGTGALVFLRRNR